MPRPATGRPANADRDSVEVTVARDDRGSDSCLAEPYKITLETSGQNLGKPWHCNIHSYGYDLQVVFAQVSCGEWLVNEQLVLGLRCHSGRLAIVPAGRGLCLNHKTMLRLFFTPRTR
jgi:hypothetical protein